MGGEEMKEYLKYQHVEKLGNDEVDGILLGDVYIFPKIDGTNAHVWCDENDELHFGSRNRELSLDKDNAGFMNAMISDRAINDLFSVLGKGYHVFGEWLVPHSLKTYRDDAWRKFYVFDITYVEDGRLRHMAYNEYQPMLEQTGVNYIAPLRIIKNPQVENIMRVLDDNNFLIKDGEGTGEGVVCKNYDFFNKYGRQIWAKIVTAEFKEKHTRVMGAPSTKGTDFIEEKIVDEFLTEAMIEKTYAKIKLDEWNSKKIPQLLGMCWHDLITECIWDVLKKFKNPKINFKDLNRFMIIKIKQTKPELF
jgi:hypothetical protein